MEQVIRITFALNAILMMPMLPVLMQIKLVFQKELKKIKVGFDGAEDRFDWSIYGNLEGLTAYRKKAVTHFLEDYQTKHIDDNDHPQQVLAEIMFLHYQ